MPVVDFGNVTLDDVVDTFVNATATVTCMDGYDASSASISCLASGDWEVGTTCDIHGN